MLMIWVDESEEQDHAVLAGILARECRDDDEPDHEPHEVGVCRAMWKILQGLGLVEVNLSRFAHRIRFSSARNRRNPIMLNDLIRSAAMLRFFQRDRRTLDSGQVRLYAIEQDFKTAADIFTALHGEAGSQDTKLTKRESQILDLIDRANLAEFSMLQIQSLTQIPYQQVYRTFLGYVSRGAKYSGLLEKCPALATLEKATTTAGEDGGASVRRRVTAFTFNREIYSSWTKGGLVWLRPDDGTSPDPCAGDFQRFQHIFSTFSAGAENKTGHDLATYGGDNQESSSICTEGSLFSADLKSTHSPPDTDAEPPVCPCDPRSAENKNGKLPCVTESARKLPAGPRSLSAVAENVLKIAEGAENVQSRPVAEPALTLAQVNPGDYSPIADGSLIEPCPVCGGRVVHYTERFQARLARGKQETSRHICRGCYNRARAREQAAVQILPGAIPLDEVKPVDPGLLGRCSVCGLQVAAYCHAGSGTAICSVCYEKLVREQVDVR